VQLGGCARFAPGKDQLHSVRRSVSSMRSWCAQVSIIYGIRGRVGNESPTMPNPPWLGKGKAARQTANCHSG